MSPTPTTYQTLLTTLLSHPHTFFSPPTSPVPLHIPQTSTSPHPTISSLSLHPVIESLLHILNGDLPSAHFLCRHAEVAPKYESMYVHGILHRIEGDIDNTRCWYGDVKGQEGFEYVWGEEEGGGDGELSNGTGKGGRPEAAKAGWEGFLDRLERYRDRTAKRRRKSKGKTRKDSSSDSAGDGQGFEGYEIDDVDWTKEAEMLREASLWEIMRMLRFCEDKFGTQELGVQDAKKEFMGKVESGDERLAEVAQGMVTGGEGWREF